MAFFTTLRTDIPVLPTDDEDVDDDDYSTEEENSAMVSFTGASCCHLLAPCLAPKILDKGGNG